jgi:flagellar biosynthesis component FlhA
MRELLEKVLGAYPILAGLVAPFLLGTVVATLFYRRSLSIKNNEVRVLEQRLKASEEDLARREKELAEAKKDRLPKTPVKEWTEWDKMSLLASQMLSIMAEAREKGRLTVRIEDVYQRINPELCNLFSRLISKSRGTDKSRFLPGGGGPTLSSSMPELDFDEMKRFIQQIERGIP